MKLQQGIGIIGIRQQYKKDEYIAHENRFPAFHKQTGQDSYYLQLENFNTKLGWKFIHHAMLVFPNQMEPTNWRNCLVQIPNILLLLTHATGLHPLN